MVIAERCQTLQNIQQYVTLYLWTPNIKAGGKWYRYIPHTSHTSADIRTLHNGDYISVYLSRWRYDARVMPPSTMLNLLTCHVRKRMVITFLNINKKMDCILMKRGSSHGRQAVNFLSKVWPPHVVNSQMWKKITYTGRNLSFSLHASTGLEILKVELMKYLTFLSCIDLLHEVVGCLYRSILIMQDLHDTLRR